MMVHTIYCFCCFFFTGCSQRRSTKVCVAYASDKSTKCMDSTNLKLIVTNTQTSLTIALLLFVGPLIMSHLHLFLEMMSPPQTSVKN